MSTFMELQTMLRIFAETEPAAPVSEITDFNAIRRELAAIGVHFERIPHDGNVPAGDDEQTILAACGSVVDYVRRDGGYATADVVSVRSGQPDNALLRAKFLAEHQHSDDEVRYFVKGSGAFYLHPAGRVYQVICVAGDLLSVPAGARHWFDMGPNPRFTAIRWFNNPAGWAAEFTGDPIAARFPRYE